MSDRLPPSPVSAAQPRLKRPIFLLDALGFCAGMLTAFHPTILSGFERIQTDPGDPTLNHYFLEHSWRWASDKDYPATFWSPRFFHPTPKTLTYSENMIGVAPFYWGLRLFFPREVAWQWWFLLMSAANFWAMRIVLRWFGVNPFLAVLGGFLFAFGLPRQDQFAHAQLMPHAFAPFAVWYFWKFTRQPDRRRWFLILFLTAWQLLASIHLGWFLLFALSVWFVSITAIDRPTIARCWTFLKRQPIFAIAAFAIWIGGLWLFFRVYYEGNQSFRRLYIECFWFMPQISAWFAAPNTSAWNLHLVPGADSHYAERHLFTGIGFYLLLAVGLVGAWRWRKDASQRPLYVLTLSATGACFTMAIFTLNFGGGFSPWYAIYRVVPGANSIRVVGRVYFSVVLLGSIGSLVAIQQLLTTRCRSSFCGHFVSGALLLLCAGEQFRTEMDSFRRADFYPRAAALAEELIGADAAYVQFDPRAIAQIYEHQITCMWAGMDANMPVINGFSGRKPPDYFNDETDVPVETIVRYLGESWQGRLLIVRWGSPMRKWYYDVRPGYDPSHRISLVRTVP